MELNLPAGGCNSRSGSFPAANRLGQTDNRGAAVERFKYLLCDRETPITVASCNYSLRTLSSDNYVNGALTLRDEKKCLSGYRKLK
jgi:hypothetical protein